MTMTTPAVSQPPWTPGCPQDPGRVAGKIDRYQRRLSCDSEDVLLNCVAQLLAMARVPLEREASLGPAGRAGVVACGSIVVDVMVGGSAEDAAGRLRRYASSPGVTAIILVTPLAQHRAVPSEVSGKPVFVVWLRSPDPCIGPPAGQREPAPARSRP